MRKTDGERFRDAFVRGVGWTLARDIVNALWRAAFGGR